MNEDEKLFQQLYLLARAWKEAVKRLATETILPTPD
jgi:hypothetical protein